MTPDAEAEIESLRTEIRRLKGRAGALTIGVFAVMGMVVASLILTWSAPPERYVSARGFLLKDASGRTRAVLGVSSGGTASLTVTDDAGAARAALSVDAEGSPALVLDSHDGARAVVGAQRLRAPGQYPGERRVERRNAASIVLIDSARTVFWSAP